MQAIHNSDDSSVTYLTQRQAAEVDEILMGPLGFSVDQLMGISRSKRRYFCIRAIWQVYKSSEYSRVLAICGPGNNGGDGLVAAHHLYHFGYKPFVCYPKRTPRPPFDGLIQKLVHLQKCNQTRGKSSAIVSVDIPSGWHVEEGDVGGDGIKPDMLVSLTAPRLRAKRFSGPHHFLGGRFLPPSIVEKFKLHLSPYPSTSMCVRIGKIPQIDISSLRENYISPEFLEDQVEANPIDQFRRWFDDAVAAGLKEPKAMALATAGKDGQPSSRMVLLKGVDKDGFVWYTNCESRKAHELSENHQASLLFYWDGLNWQVRVEGSVQKVSDEESEQNLHSRPQGSQIWAIVSKQSTVIPRRHVLYQQYEELEEKFSNVSLISKPKHWGGYRLKPKRFEFWQGQQSRLHDRLQYVPEEINGTQVWKIVRLAP